MFKKLLILAFVIITFSFSACKIETTHNNDSAAELQRSQAAALNFYIGNGNSLDNTDSLNRFLSETAKDAQIEIVFELPGANLREGLI